MTTRKELIEALQARYRIAAFSDRIKILDEFVALTGYHRKHAIRLLRQEVGTALPANATSARSRLYDEAVRQALTVLWEAADRVCGKRLKALIPLLVDAMERHGHLDLDPVGFCRSKGARVSKLLSLQPASSTRWLFKRRQTQPFAESHGLIATEPPAAPGFEAGC